MVDLFHNSTKAIPKDKPDAFIVRVPMRQNEIGGRTDHIPVGPKSEASISHIPNKS